LGEHEGEEAGAGADVEDILDGRSLILDRKPGTENAGIGADLHGAVVLLDGELFEGEIMVGH
jgi:hypothetical protein